jgi:hypothetical protein
MFTARLNRGDLEGAINQAIAGADEAKAMGRKARVELRQRQWDLTNKANEALNRNKPL